MKKMYFPIKQLSWIRIRDPGVQTGIRIWIVNTAVLISKFFRFLEKQIGMVYMSVHCTLYIMIY